MFTALIVTFLLLTLGTLSVVGVVVAGVLKLAFKLIGLVLGFGLMMVGGLLTLGLGLGIGLALLVPLLPLLALIALVWVIARATRPAPAPVLTYAPRH